MVAVAVVKGEIGFTGVWKRNQHAPIRRLSTMTVKRSGGAAGEARLRKGQKGNWMGNHFIRFTFGEHMLDET